MATILRRTIPDDIQWFILSFLLKLPLPMRRRCLAITKINRVCKKTSTMNIYCCHHQKRINNTNYSPYFAHGLIIHYDYLKRLVPKTKTKPKIKTKKLITDYYYGY